MSTTASIGTASASAEGGGGDVAADTLPVDTHMTDAPAEPSSSSPTKATVPTDASMTEGGEDAAGGGGGGGEATFLFASESVTESHPDKLCDVISDAIVDACLTLDPASRIACETVCKTGVVIVLGEITTSASINYEQVIRDAVRDAGTMTRPKDWIIKLVM